MREFKYVVTSSPFFTASPIIPKIALQFIALPPFAILISEEKAFTAFTSSPGSSEEEKGLTMDVKTHSKLSAAE